MYTKSKQILWLSLLLLATALSVAAGATTYDNPPCIHFEGRCGDLDSDWDVTISDVVYLVQYIFNSGSPPPQMWCGDCDLNGSLNLTDAVYLVAYIFGGGPSPCTGSGRLDYAGGTPFESCIEYDYDGAGLLRLTHINSGFNCCPQELTIEMFVYTNGHIYVEEAEDFGGGESCPCLCLYDLECESSGVEPGIYLVNVEEPYLNANDAPLIFSLDLSEACSGTYCVYRDQYPWGDPW